MKLIINGKSIDVTDRLGPGRFVQTDFSYQVICELAGVPADKKFTMTYHRAKAAGTVAAEGELKYGEHVLVVDGTVLNVVATNKA